MKKSLPLFISKLQEAKGEQLKDGFITLKKLRGGVLPTSNSGDTCINSKTCSGSNTYDCNNTGNCSDSTNKRTCSNSGTCFY